MVPREVHRLSVGVDECIPDTFVQTRQRKTVSLLSLFGESERLMALLA